MPWQIQLLPLLLQVFGILGGFLDAILNPFF